MINGEKNEEHDEINGASKALILYKIDNQCRKIIWKILKAKMETLSSQQKKGHSLLNCPEQLVRWFQLFETCFQKCKIKYRIKMVLAFKSILFEECLDA